MNEYPQQENTVHIPLESYPKKKKKIIGRIIGGVVLLMIAYAVYHLASVYLSPDKSIQQIYLIPHDAAFIIQSKNPVRDWEKFSGSNPWQCLSQSKSFAEISERAHFLDSVFRENKNLLSLVGEREMMISGHKIRAGFWDCLFVVDLQKVSKVNVVKTQAEQLYKLMDYRVTHRTYNEIDIMELRDPKTKDILYTAFVDNHYIASYSSSLIEASIDERNDPKIGLNPVFIETEKVTPEKGLCRIFINYAYLPSFLEIYMGEKNEFVSLISNSMNYAGFSFDSGKDKMELKGYTFLNEEPDPYVTAFLHSGKQMMRAHSILSERTASYINIGFDDPITFVRELEKTLAEKDEKMYETYKSSVGKVESLFGISLEEHFLSWMSGEFALTQSEPGLLGREPETMLAIRVKNREDARKNMEIIEGKVKKRTPINVKTVHYKGYEIKYTEMKGFFRLFFGKMFDKFEKPYYTYIEDYVVFSNKPASLLSFVEDYEQKRLLKDDKEFKNTLSRFEENSTFFTYLNTRKFFPLMKPLLSSGAWNDLQPNRNIVYSFPHAGFQVIGDKYQVDTRLLLGYKPYEEVDPEEEEETSVDYEEELSEGEIMSELKRFYVEKFQGNVYREFYPDGAIRSESEIKDGKRSGKYREYYEDGTLKIYGKYSKNQPKGTWKFYTPDGKLERKEKPE